MNYESEVISPLLRCWKVLQVAGGTGAHKVSMRVPLARLNSCPPALNAKLQALSTSLSVNRQLRTGGQDTGRQLML